MGHPIEGIIDGQGVRGELVLRGVFQQDRPTPDQKASAEYLRSASPA